MAQQERFQYQDQIGRGSFRLFLIQPSSDISAPLVGKLDTTALRAYDESISDHYIALSYVWGDQSDRRTAFINGQLLDITASLDSALRHIRDQEKKLKIWADGICINQMDIEERNIQVQQMGLIYQLARHTIIYLGESTPASAALLDALNSSSTTLETHGSGYMANVAHVFNHDSDLQTNSNRNHSEDVQLFDSDLIAQEWPWFSRIWVLQELLLSLDPWVQIGLQRHRWDVFINMLHLCSQSGHIQEGLLHASAMMKFRNTLTPSLWQRQVSSDMNCATRLLEILHSRRGLGVTDPRDMIYGHLGVLGFRSPDSELEKIVRVDYNQSVSALFSQVTVYMISARFDFDILSHVADIPLENRTDFPTWVPDWTSQNFSRKGVARLEDHASSRKHIGRFCISLSLGDSQVLGTFGRYVGKISTVLDSRPPKMDLNAIIETLSQRYHRNSFSGKKEIIEQIYVILHDQLIKWFKEQGAEPLVGYRLTPRSYYDVTYRSIGNKDWEILWDWIAAHVYQLSHPLGPAPKIDESTITEEIHIMTSLFLDMTDTRGAGSFPGKKIALDQNGDILFVPMNTLAGDHVYQFCPDPKAWILREIQPSNREEIDAKLLESFKGFRWSSPEGSITWIGRPDKKPYTAERALWKLSRDSVYHVNFIGGCDPEPRFPQGDEYSWKTYIFAMH